MRRSFILGLLVAVSAFIATTTASALDLDANIGGIFTDSTLSTMTAGTTIAPNGDTATATLAAGNFVLIEVVVDNAPEDLVTGIFTTITIQGNQVDFFAPNAPGTILVEPGFGGASLGNIGTGAVKGNSPNNPGDAGDVWVQSLAYGDASGTTGTGPDTIQLLFEVTGASGSDAVEFVLGLTDGDAIGPAGVAATTTFSSASINVPEPGSLALAITSLGTVGLIARVRRRN